MKFKIETQFKLTLFLLVSLLVCISGSFSFASLGESISSVHKNGREIHADIKKVSPQNISDQNIYQVYSLVSEMTEVKQYLDNRGIVFAVTWKGANHPDLSKLLGEFYQEFSIADEEQPVSRSQPMRKVSTEQIVVEKSGHMGAVQGKAYLPRSIPEGVEIESLL